MCLSCEAWLYELLSAPSRIDDARIHRVIGRDGLFTWESLEANAVCTMAVQRIKVQVGNSTQLWSDQR